MFDKMKEMMALQKKVQAIQEKLGNTHIEADEGEYTVIISGKMGPQECLEIKVNGESMPKLVKAMNKALKKSHEVATNEMKSVMGHFGNLGLPGL